MQVGPSLRKVLVVEDSDEVAVVLEEGLERQGYAVLVAHNAPVALRLAPDFAPDVALIDIGLPVMNGWELAKRLRALCPAVRIIALTAFTDDDARARSAELGFADHLVKPVKLDEIAGAIQRVAAS